MFKSIVNSGRKEGEATKCFIAESLRQLSTIREYHRTSGLVSAFQLTSSLTLIGPKDTMRGDKGDYVVKGNRKIYIVDKDTFEKGYGLT